MLNTIFFFEVLIATIKMGALPISIYQRLFGKHLLFHLKIPINEENFEEPVQEKYKMTYNPAAQKQTL
jgi:hypothetical protein